MELYRFSMTCIFINFTDQVRNKSSMLMRVPTRNRWAFKWSKASSGCLMVSNKILKFKSTFSIKKCLCDIPKATFQPRSRLSDCLSTDSFDKKCPLTLIDLGIDVKLFKGRGQGEIKEYRHIFVVEWWMLSHFLKKEEICCSRQFNYFFSSKFFFIFFAILFLKNFQQFFRHLSHLWRMSTELYF